MSFDLNLENMNIIFFFFNILWLINLLPQQIDKRTAVFSLQLTLGLMVLPEFTPFPHTAHLEARLVNQKLDPLKGNIYKW